jgi:hypothetical protein
MRHRVTLAAPLLAAALMAGCATAPASTAQASAEDCAVVTLLAGLVGETQPPLQLIGRTRDVDALMRGRRFRVVIDDPERWSPDATPAQIAALGAARQARRGQSLVLACRWTREGDNPFRPWAPGRAQLLISAPAFTPDRAFAVDEMVVILPGDRVDYYRFIVEALPNGRWDLHRMEFASVKLPR